MWVLSASELLAAWERGLARRPADRALGLLSAASPQTPPEALARLSIGRRDARLLELREAVFGREVTGLAACAGCGEKVELSFDTRAIRPPPAPAAAREGAETTAGELAIDVDGYHFLARLPTSEDLSEIEGAADVDDARWTLLRRCVSVARRGEEAVDVGQLPGEVTAALARGLAEADPQADVRLAVTCPACGLAWQESFDIVSFLWAEVHGWAVRLLREVHDLARGYGWREADILAMSPWRRQAYLEMLAG